LKPSFVDQVASENIDLRYEIKLVCGPHLLSQARSWIRLHPAGLAVAYPPRRVNSLYLDTLDLNHLNENLSGLSVRQKLRLRWYGDQTTDIVHPLLELKQKHNLLGRKKQSHLPCRLDLTQPWTEILETMRANTEPDWRLILRTVDWPTLITTYQREYYITPDGAVRVTLDFAQSAYCQRYAPRPNLHSRLPISDNVVIEIKTAWGQEERLQEMAANFPVRRSRNSKYVNSLLAALG
jgi:hypothetical protein